jgi:hypothetical protein
MLFAVKWTHADILRALAALLDKGLIRCRVDSRGVARYRASRQQAPKVETSPRRTS